jgi:hypothetical protein
MENSNTGPVVNKGSNTKTLILFGLIIFFIATLAYGYYQNKNNQSKNSTSSSEWTEFKSEKYGFKFEYPKEWKMPNITERSAETGKTYSVNFPPFSKSKETSIISTLSMVFDSKDLKFKVCDDVDKGICSDVIAFTESDVKATLSANKTGLLFYDSDSYTNLSSEQQQNTINSLSIVRIVKLPKIQVSAVRASYILRSDAPDCLKNALSPSSANGCITKVIYDTFSRIVDSIKPL